MNSLNGKSVLSLGIIEASTETEKGGILHTATGLFPIARIMSVHASSRILFNGHELRELGGWTSFSSAVDEAQGKAKYLGVLPTSEIEIATHCEITEETVILAPMDAYSSCPMYKDRHDDTRDFLDVIQSKPAYETKVYTFEKAWSTKNTDAENKAFDAEIASIINRGQAAYSRKNDVIELFKELEELSNKKRKNRVTGM